MPNNTKPSGIDWIGDVPAEWGKTRLGFLFIFEKGLSITKEDLREEGIPCVSYGEIHSKYGFEVNPEKDVLKCVDEKYLRTDRKSLLKYGDFLFADTSEDLEGSGNFTYLNSNTKTFAGYHTIILRPKENINHRYIAYLFDSISFRIQIRNKVWGIKVYSITQSILKNAKITLPPLKEQQVIASFLDAQCSRIDGIIAEMEQQIEVLKQYKTSLITETVTKGLNKSVFMKNSGIDWIGNIPTHWEVKRLKYCLSTPLQYGANEVGFEFNEKEPRYVRITDITLDNKLKEDDKLSLPLRIAKPYLLNDGDILFARSGATVGKTFYFDGKYGQAAFAGYMIRAVINRNFFLPEYVYYITLGNSYQNWLNLVYSQATIQNIGANKYENFPTICPPIKEQKQIVIFLNNRCERVDAIIQDKRQSIETMKAYKKSLIYEYVTGKKQVVGFHDTIL